MFVLRVNDAGGMVSILELDDVLAQMMRSAGELVTQRLGLPLLEMGATDLVAADADVGCAQVYMGIHIAHVQRERIFASQLPDRVDRLEPVNPLLERSGPVAHSAVTSTADRPPSTGRATPVM